MYDPVGNDVSQNGSNVKYPRNKARYHNLICAFIVILFVSLQICL